MLNVFLANDSAVEDLSVSGAASCSKTRLSFSDDLLRLGFEPVEYDLQHGFTRVTREADCSISLAQL